MRPKYALKIAGVSIACFCGIYIGIIIGVLPNTRGLINNMKNHRSYMESIKYALQTKLSEELNSTHKDIDTHTPVSILTDTPKPLGYERAAFLQHACSSYTKTNTQGGRVRVSYDPTFKVLYCPLCKIASTFWTRAFKMAKLNSDGRSKKVATPFGVPISQAPKSTLYYDKRLKTVTGFGDASNAFKFLVVRNPFGMLFSAYVDKIVGPNPVFWKEFGNPAVRFARHRHSDMCGSDVTFEEFIRYVGYVGKSGRLDCHIAKFDACQPCQMNYTYVATMETFKDDTIHILKLLNQTETLTEFENTFSDLHANDAIDDSVSGPFSWKPRITQCISWHEALQGIWRKLQMRGVIANQEPFPLTEDESKNVTRTEFVNVLQTARKRSTVNNNQKREAYLKEFRQVPVDALDAVRKVYEQEFKLFNYDDRPKEIFDRDETRKAAFVYHV